MAINIKHAVSVPSGQSAVPKKKSSGHTKAVPLQLDLNGPGRVRVGHILFLLSIAHSTFYRRLNSGKFPPRDGWDGIIPYWNTTTIRNFLEAKN